MELRHWSDKLKIIIIFKSYDAENMLHKARVYKFSKNLGASSKF